MKTYKQEQKSCETCEHFFKEEGECRRYPPSYQGFPIIGNTYKPCGEYKEKK